MVQLFDENDVRLSLPTNSSLLASKLAFNTAQANRKADTQADVLLRFPYPPVDCAEALAVVKQINDEIRQRNENIAADISVSLNKRYIGALQDALKFFNAYVSINQCQEKLVKEAEEAYNSEWQAILAQEKAQTSNSGKSTYIILGALGLLVVTSIVIIVKKKKA